MSGKQRRVYKCTTCARVFKRSEHCSRHERIHTRERPFACQYCHKKYARKDLVTRHEKTLHSEKRRQSIATAVPDSPDSRRSSESTETINVSIPSNASSQPDLRQSFEPEIEAPPHVALAENFAPMATSAELSPHQLSVTDDRRSSQILVPTDVMSPSFAFGSAVEALYPSPQSCPEQAPGSLQPWGEPVVAFQEVPMQAPFMPIDPQLCGPQQSLDLDLMSPRHSRGSKAAVPSIESRNDSMDAAQETMSPPTKRRRLTNRGSHSVDTHRASQHDWHHDLDSSSIDIFRDFWSPPEPPSNMAQNHMDSLITPESLEFSIPIDPFLTGGQDQQSASLFDSSFSFKGPSMNSSVLSRKSFPEESKESNSDQAKLAVGPEIYCSIRADLQARTRKEDWDDSKLPNAKELQKFIEGYINCFHRHFPVVHFHSMNLESTPSPLILAICCIGALYRLDRRRAAVLYELASPLLHSAISASRKVNSSSPGPLWAVQGSLLLAMYSVFSGRTALVLSSIERSGFFVSEYRIRRTCSAAEFSRGNSTWEDWISEESGKRVLCGILILSNLISVAYGTSPWFSVGEDLQVELPAKDGLWDAKTAAQWTEAKSKAHEGSRQTVKEAMLDTLSQDQSEDTPEDNQMAWGFAGLVIAHAANIHVWHLSQISQCPGNNNKSALLLDAASSIEKCQHALNHGRGGSGNGCSEDYRHPHHASPPSDDSQTTSSLVSNTNALLRIASTRLFGVGAAAPAFNRFALASDSDRVVSAAVDAYLRAPMDDDRSNGFATKGARQACEGFMLPAKVGSPLLVRKTAAFGWSVEHAVAWWDASLFLSKWVHAAQQRERASAGLEEEERTILKDVEACLGELEVDFDAAAEGASLAAAVARACAAFLSDTWVWGVTPRMGSVLMKLADAYEKDFKEAVEC
ncbi:Zinc finger C2H2-type protein [Lasiodiplodia theobromae]|nr:Zinc finger C2H2-type protein [Lasiodiplodia theobromae]